MFRVFRLKRDEKGQSLVEFALILPILLLIILGTIQFGIIFSSQIAVTNAAREGARVAAVGGSNTEILTRVQNSLGGHIFLNPISATNISVTPNPRTNSDRGNEVTVLIDEVTLDLFVPVPGIFASNSEVELSGQAAMRLEHLPGEDDEPAPPGDDDPTPPGDDDPTPPGDDDPTPPEYDEYIHNRIPPYNSGDKVKYNGENYISIVDNNDKRPSNTNNWRLLDE